MCTYFITFVALVGLMGAEGFNTRPQSLLTMPRARFSLSNAAPRLPPRMSTPIGTDPTVSSPGVAEEAISLIEDVDTSQRPVDYIKENPEILAILVVYFVQGALGLSRLAVSYYMKDKLQLTPADMANIGGITTLPWVIKPLYGFLSDGFPLFGYRRRSYLLAAGIIGSMSWLALGADVAQDTASLVLLTVLGSASVAVSDVVIDSVVVEKSRCGEVEGGDLQSLCWGSAAVGGILSAYFSGSLLSTMRPQEVFTITAIFPLLISVSALAIKETRATKEVADSSSPYQEQFAAVQRQLGDLLNTLKQPSIYLPVLFIFGYSATPDPGAAMFYFNTNELGFSPEFLGKVRLVSSFTALLGVLLYRSTLKNWRIKDVIFWSALLSIPLGLSQVLLTTHWNRTLGIPDELFVLGDSAVLAALGQIAFMPTLVLAAKLCPPGAEGTVFASLMSIYNFSGTVASELGALLTSTLGVVDGKYDNLTLLVAICALSGLLPLPFIDLLDVVDEQEGEDGEKAI
jgi:folate/biopterin transporter